MSGYINHHDAILITQVLSTVIVFQFGNALADSTPKAALWMLMTLIAIWWR